MGNELQPLTGEQRKWLTNQGINEDTWRALQASLFPGAEPRSLQLYWHYCMARKLDPMKKPAHIVPMPVTDARTGNKTWQDVIMPGIAEARITANRTGQYAGQDEPVFGPVVDLSIGGVTMTVPEYCTVRVYRKIAGERFPYSHTEYFVEAVNTNKHGAPNAVWKKRPRGQLAKCAEAGALRKGFPEELGGTITADEANDEIGVISVATSERPDSTEALRSLHHTKDEPAAEPLRKTATEVVTERASRPVDASEPERPRKDPREDPSAGIEWPGEQHEPDPEAEHPGTNKVALVDATGEIISHYSRAGAFINAAVKLLTSHDQDPEAVQRVYDANKQVLESIRTTGRHDDKLADLESLVAKLTTASPVADSPDPEPGRENDDWLEQYDKGATQTDADRDEAILGDISDDLEEHVVAGNADEIRRRINLAAQITDENERSSALDLLDEALARSQSAAARGAFGGE